MNRTSETCGTPSSRPTFWKSQKQKREKGAEKLFGEIMDKNFPNLMKDINIQEAQWTPIKMNLNKPTL